MLGSCGFPSGEEFGFHVYVCILDKANPHNHLKSRTNIEQKLSYIIDSLCIQVLYRYNVKCFGNFPAVQKDVF